MRILLLIFLATLCVAQDDLPAAYPHPYVSGGFSGNGAGYSSKSFNAEAGIQGEWSHASLNIGANYDNAKKANDATIDNHSGRVRTVRGVTFYRYHNWHFGGGGEFTQTSTTNYSKQAAHFLTGGGYDWRKDYFSVRTDALYISRAINEQTHYPDGTQCHCTNGVHGFELGISIPSPASTHRVFFRETVESVWFHDTVTDPMNVPLTKKQERNGHVTTFLQLEILYRF